MSDDRAELIDGEPLPSLEEVRALCEKLYKTEDQRTLDTLVGEACCFLELQAKALASRSPPSARGYQEAFYELAEMMGLGARPESPKEVWETVMKPRLAEALANSPVPCGGEKNENKG